MSLARPPLTGMLESHPEAESPGYYHPKTYRPARRYRKEPAVMSSGPFHLMCVFFGHRPTFMLMLEGPLWQPLVQPI
jgi:hypothetical protein